MVFSLKSSKSEIYASIQKSATNSVCPVLIFVASTVDSLCALKILVHMFRTDFIPYKIIPVSGFNELSVANEDHVQGQEDIRSIIMIGCGGIVDLSEYLSLSNEVSVYVFDSNRPYNLRNLFSNTQITIVDDGFIQNNKQDLEDAYFALDFSDSDSDSDSEEYDDDEFDSENENEEEDLSDFEDRENDESYSNQLKLSSRKGSEKEKRIPKEFKNMCREKLEDYSNGFWTGSPLSAILFDLCDSRGCANNDLLWYAIAGTTDLYLRTCLNEEAYHVHLHTLKNAQERLNPNSVQKSRSDSNTSSIIYNSDGTISYESDIRFVLMRHWTVYNSMLNSDFVASRLCSWREKGKNQIDLLFARMAIPLNQCKSDYSAMDLEYRELLTLQLEKFASEFNIQNFSFSSFSRDFGYILKVSAADYVHSLRAILESPSRLAISRSVVLSDNIPTWKSNFFFAFDALEYKNSEHVKMGIELSMKQHSIIYKEVCTILSHRLIKLGKHFRYVILRSGIDMNWFLNPSTLLRLCKFLVDSTKSQKKGSALPLVIAVTNPATETYLVLSSDGESYFEDEEKVHHKSIVGPMFMKAARLINARVKMDTFDLSAIEIRSADFKPFIKSLQNIVNSN